MTVSTLQLQNFRCFREMPEPVRFHPNLTVLVAKNGKGKTAFLDALRISLGTFTRAFTSRSQANISRMDASLQPLRISQGRGACYPVRIIASGVVNGSEANWERELAGNENRTTSKKAKAITEYADELHQNVSSDGVEVELPLVGYYGTDRLWSAGIENSAYSGRDFVSQGRIAGYEDALTEDSIYLQVKKWLAYASHVTANSIEAKTDIGIMVSNQLKAVGKAVDRVLDGTGMKSLHYNFTYNEAAVIDESVKPTDGADYAIAVPVSQTSDGTKAAIALVADIAFRCARLNPQYGQDACCKTSGIVMIDEVDLFLHPSWQQHILTDLREIFPKIQFVVTTHSPQVVASVPSECIRVIEDSGKVEEITKSEGVAASYVLKEVFGTEPYPPKNELRIKLNEYLKAVYAGRWEDPEIMKLGESLMDRFSGVDSDFDVALLHIENEKWEKEHASS